MKRPVALLLVLLLAGCAAPTDAADPEPGATTTPTGANPAAPGAVGCDAPDLTDDAPPRLDGPIAAFEEGDAWEYTYTRGEDEGAVSMRYDGPAADGAHALLRQIVSPGGFIATAELVEGTLALAALHVGGAVVTFEPPLTSYHAQDHTWRGHIVDSYGGSTPARADIDVIGWERVSVPAGEFDALRIDSVLRECIENGNEQVSSAWLVPALKAHARLDSDGRIEELVSTTVAR